MIKISFTVGVGVADSRMGTYLQQADKQNDRLGLQVHLQAAIELLSDVLHVLVVTWFPKHSLSGWPFLPQQQQQLLVEVRVKTKLSVY